MFFTYDHGAFSFLGKGTTFLVKKSIKRRSALAKNVKLTPLEDRVKKQIFPRKEVKTMLVSINSTTITPEEIRITAANLEVILLADDIYSHMDDDNEVSFVFDASNLGHKKYLFRLCQSQRQAKDKKSLGEMIEALPGCILSVSENFLER